MPFKAVNVNYDAFPLFLEHYFPMDSVKYYSVHSFELSINNTFVNNTAISSGHRELSDRTIMK